MICRKWYFGGEICVFLSENQVKLEMNSVIGGQFLYALMGKSI